MLAHSKSDDKKDQWFVNLLTDTPMQIDSVLSGFDTHLFCNVLALEAEDFISSLPREDAGVVVANMGQQNELAQGLTLSQSAVKDKLSKFMTFALSLSVLLRSGDYTTLIAGLESVLKEYAQWIEEDSESAALHPEKYPNLRPFRLAFAEGLDFKQVVACTGSLFKQFYMKFDSFSADILANKQLFDTVIRFDQFVKQDFLKFVIKVMGEVSRVVVGNALSDKGSVYALNHAWQTRKNAKAASAKRFAGGTPV